MALNRIAGLSKEGDWQVHGIEHQVGAYTDCPHGIGLAIVSIPYYKHIYKYGIKKFSRLARAVFDLDTEKLCEEEAALAAISAIEGFIRELGIPTRLRDIGATEDMLPLIAYSVCPEGGYKKMTHEEILDILRECY